VSEELALAIIAGDREPDEATIVHILSEASDQYHNSEDGTSFISDADYDALERMLKALNPKNLFLSGVGSDVRGGKIDLPVTLGSLDQVYEGETLDWVTKNGWLDQDFVITDKEDGTSALNVYSKKKLAIAYSRGNGYQGADITRHMSKIVSVPKTSTENCMIRSEVIMEDNLFASQKAQAEVEGGRVYANARNYVAGRMNASTSPQLFYDTVKVIGTSVIEPKMNKSAQLKFMAAMGFEVPHNITVKGRQLTDAFLIKYLTERREQSPTAIDGIVIDLDDAAIVATLTRNSSSINPMSSKKFKVGAEDNVAVVEVINVHWNPSKAGYLKPRVEIKPVELAGVTITYATGFNAKFIRDNLIGPGAKIQITRAGDVIPFIQKVIEPAAVWQEPSKTEFGDMFWTVNDDGVEVDLVMKDLSLNKQVQLEIINGMFGVTGLNVPHIREGSIEKLYNAGLTTPVSIILADEATLKAGAGDSAGTKIYEGLKAKLANVELGVLAGATSLLGRGIGRRKMTKLIEALGNDAVLTEYPGPLLAKKIAGLEGFEEKTSTTIVRNLPAFRDFLKEIDGYYAIVAPKAAVVGGDLDGVTVVFTGIRDKELEEKITARSGKIGSSVNKDTTYLVAKDPSGNSGKLVKARDLIGADNVISIADAKAKWG
jgi:DNA ligase (NAD+)